MSAAMDEEIKRWTARRKSALVLEIIQGKTTLSEASEQYERQLKDLQEAYGEAMLELRARKLWRPCWARTRPDGHDPAGTAGRRDPRIDGAALPLVRATTVDGVLPADQGASEGEG